MACIRSLIFLVQKKDIQIKGRTCANGSTQQEYVNQEDATSPTAATESILLTATIDAEEGRNAMTVNIPKCICANGSRLKERASHHENSRNFGCHAS
jgi:hypothetical protein